MGLQKKAGIFGGLGLLMLVGVLAFWGIRAVNKSTQRSLDERVLIAQTVAQSVDHTLSQSLNDLERFATLHAQDMENQDPGPTIQALDDFYLLSQSFALVFLLDEEARVVHTYPSHPEWVGKPFIDLPAVMAVLGNLPPHISSTFAADSSETRVFSLVVPMVSGKGTLLGVIGGHIDLSVSGVSALISPASLGNTAYAEIVDENGEVIATTKSPSDAASTEETEYAAHLATLVKANQATQEKCYRCHQTEKGIERRRDVLAFAPLSTVLGGVAIRQSEEEALAPSRELKRDMLLGGGFVFVLGVASIWLITRGLVHPIVQLTVAARRISRGDFHAQITSNRDDELGELSTAFDQMRLNLRDSLEQKEERARESEERARQLSALNAVAATVSRSLELDRVLEDSLDEALRIMQLEAGGIWLAEGEPAQLTLKAHRGTVPRWPGVFSGLGEEVGFSAMVLPLQDAATPSSQGPESFVYVPLVSKGKVLGAMVLTSMGQRRFDPRERDLLTAFGHQVGVGVDNAQLFQESQRREKEAQALNLIGVEVSRLLDLDKILGTVVESSRQLLEADLVILSLWDEVSRQIYTKAAGGPMAPDFEGLRLRMGEGIAGKVLSLGRAVTSEDYINDPSITHTAAEDDLLRKGGFRAYVAVPLKMGEEIRGSLGVSNTRVQRFHEREVDLLQQLANQAAVAIENARLYGQVEEMAVLEERQRIAREMHDGLGQVLAYLGLKSRELESQLASGNTLQVQEGMSEVKQVVQSAYDEVKDGILALRTWVSPQAGLIPMLENYVEGLRHQTGIAVALSVSDERATHFSPKVAIQLVRVIQEALANVRKHAHASKVDVRFDVVDGYALVTVEDDGIGFDPAQSASDSLFHFGLQTIQERMESVGGKLTIDSHPGGGTRVVAELPLRP